MSNITMIILCTLLLKASAQNLVPNSSFENYDSCLYPNLGIGEASQWSNPTSYSPDYFNACVQDSYDHNSDVPDNYYGNQLALTGQGYAGIITAYFGFDGREYIQIKLTDSLISNVCYSIGFYVLLADSSPFAVNDIGAFFSDTSLFVNTLGNLTFQPQAENNPAANPLTIRNSWLHISDSFVANGGERFLIIGNFKNDAATDTVMDGLGGITLDYGYYYIDDIEVLKCVAATSSNLNPAGASDPQVSIESGVLSIQSSEVLVGKLTLVDIAGRVEFLSVLDSMHSWIVLPPLASGIYLVIIHLLDGQTIVRKLTLSKL